MPLGQWTGSLESSTSRSRRVPNEDRIFDRLGYTLSFDMRQEASNDNHWRNVFTKNSNGDRRPSLWVWPGNQIRKATGACTGRSPGRT